MIILIADDDRLVRFTIKSILQEILGDSGDIFLEARNGQEMANECREHHPDIAFVDIRMPVMNGLDAIAESKKYSKETEYVIVSGYSDFTYAREGIRLGVNEYLLKPADEEEIRRVMERLQEKVEKNRKDSNSRFQLRVMNAFSYYSSMGAGEDKKREPHGDKAGNDTGKKRKNGHGIHVVGEDRKKESGAFCPSAEKTSGGDRKVGGYLGGTKGMLCRGGKQLRNPL